MTTMQRVAFFKLVGQAFAKSGMGENRDEWRKSEMAQAIPGCRSVSQVVSQSDYDVLMLHFAQLAESFDMVAKFSVAAERRLRHIMRAVAADLEFFQDRGVDDAYMLGIYRQAGAPEYVTIDDIPEEHLRLIVQIADTHVRRLRKAYGLRPGNLPSAGYPWRIRGHLAAIEADAAHRNKPT